MTHPRPMTNPRGRVAASRLAGGAPAMARKAAGGGGPTTGPRNAPGAGVPPQRRAPRACTAPTTVAPAPAARAGRIAGAGSPARTVAAPRTATTLMRPRSGP